uniref:Lateral organ boundaries domain protein n=1 Tax=Boehmeria nivea TaxID=83906 RepID=A0A172J1X5_BOENI|nr:lateral organ boundaries domain protein [Boehmeria nivea]
MRMSCNGCRILRKGCSENCSIRPCLQWIKSPESQANATVFLAKFYGRAGLMNLINAGPDHLRPAIFRSLLYEACGRIVNPIYGSVGLLWSGSWQLCQSAVEAVLKGAPITPIASEAAAATHHGPPLKAYDIRHVSKDENSAASSDPQRVRTRCRFKRTAGGAVVKTKPKKAGAEPGSKWAGYCAGELNRSSTSHDSSVSHQSEAVETESMISVETAEPAVAPPQPQPPAAAMFFCAEPETAASAMADEEPPAAAAARECCEEPALELTLGFVPAARASRVVPVKKRRLESAAGCGGACKTELGLEYAA